MAVVWMIFRNIRPAIPCVYVSCCIISSAPPPSFSSLSGLAACTGKPSLDDPPLSDRELNLEEFFARKHRRAAGQFQDVFGDGAPPLRRGDRGRRGTASG